MCNRQNLIVKGFAILFMSLVTATGQASEELFLDLNSRSSQWKGEVYLGSKYVYNAYYDYERNKPDAVLTVRPSIEGSTKPSSLGATGMLGLEYEYFSMNNVQSHFDIDGRGETSLDISSVWTNQLYAIYKNFSDPSPSETYGRIGRSLMGGGMNNKFRFGKGGVDFKVEYLIESFSNPKMKDGDYLSNTNMESILQYSQAFLPETHWFLRGTGGLRDFPRKNVRTQGNDLIVPKSSSMYGTAEAGISGRLTEKSVIDFAAGIAARSYTKPTVNGVDTTTDTYAKVDNSFNESFFGPVFYFRFTEQISRRQQLSAGYNYSVKDSYFTNYYLDQEIYIGLARVLGDQVLLMSRIGYNYRSFSLPTRREDQRIAGSLVVQYSYQPTLKFIAEAKVDLLSSDAYNNKAGTASAEDLPVNPDKSASYKAGSLGVGVVANF